MKSSLAQPIEKLAQFFESRNAREKILLIGLTAAIVLTLDYLLLVQPLAKSLAVVTPQINAEKEALKGLREDKKNQELIHAQWLETQKETFEKEKKFVSPSEVPALLENLSLTAKTSQVKLLSLTPSDTSSVGSGYSKITIRISAVAGTHEFGNFLSNLENNPTFFRVKDLKISTNSLDERRHIIELSVEVYGKNA